MLQIPLPLSLPTIFSADNFFISGCNKAAYNKVLGNWESHALYLYGKKGSGKSHLSNILAQKNGGVFLDFSNQTSLENNNFINEKIEKIPNKIIILENIETIIDEEKIFHLFNHSKNSGKKLLLTSSLLPAALPFSLPDLTSRLRACPIASINEPDDDLLYAVLQKQFSDKQLLVDDAVFSYLLPRMERSFSGLKELVEKLDKKALSEGRNITISFARKTLDQQ